jgi:hypothetical protein
MVVDVCVHWGSGEIVGLLFIGALVRAGMP